MLSFLKDHPFAVEAFFEYSLVLSFAVPKAEVLQLIPDCLGPDTFNNEWAFVAVAMVQTKKLRKKGSPEFLGNDFFLIGNRVFVQYRSAEGKRLRGLYILKSQTNKKKMEVLGNLFTHYKYATIDVRTRLDGGILKIESKKASLDVVADINKKEPALPEGSPFADWKEARRFAGPLPFTFTFNKETGNVLIIEGVRSNWIPRPVEIRAYKVGFIESLGFTKCMLANAFIIENVPYYWKKGRQEKWQQ